MQIRIRIARSEKGARFVHPMDPAPRTAILVPGFQETKFIRVFPNGWDRDALRFRPQSIAAPVDVLRALAAKELRLEHAVVAFTYEDDGAVSGADRELFWRAFGVPVFEQYLSADNRLLAMECESHSGLHVVHGCEGMSLDREPCGCGNKSPRIARGARINELVELLV